MPAARIALPAMAVWALWFATAHSQSPPQPSAACLAASDVSATIVDARRCAMERGWLVNRFWVQASNWYVESNTESTMRIMCGAPVYVTVDDARRALWQTKSIYRFGTAPQTYVYGLVRSPGKTTFKSAKAAGNQACGSLYIDDAEMLIERQGSH
jgi:hypothetical protein